MIVSLTQIDHAGDARRSPWGPPAGVKKPGRIGRRSGRPGGDVAADTGGCSAGATSPRRERSWVRRARPRSRSRRRLPRRHRRHRDGRKKRAKKKREESGERWGGRWRRVARTFGGTFGGALGDTSEDAPEEPPGHRAWGVGRRDARRGGAAEGQVTAIARAIVTGFEWTREGKGQEKAGNPSRGTGETRETRVAGREKLEKPDSAKAKPGAGNRNPLEPVRPKITPFVHQNGPVCAPKRARWH